MAISIEFKKELSDRIHAAKVELMRKGCNGRYTSHFREKYPNFTNYTRLNNVWLGRATDVIITEMLERLAKDFKAK